MSETKRLIERLGKLIKSEFIGWLSGQTKKDLKEIKWALGEYEKLKKKHFELCVEMNGIRHSPQPPNDLVEKIKAKWFDRIMAYSNCSEIILEKDLHWFAKDLLQSRQPEKVKITRVEIENKLGLFIELPYGKAMNEFVEWLKSKGFEITDK